MGLFRASIESLVPLALPTRNLIAPLEKTSPGLPLKEWKPIPLVDEAGDLGNSL